MLNGTEQWAFQSPQLQKNWRMFDLFFAPSTLAADNLILTIHFN